MKQNELTFAAIVAVVKGHMPAQSAKFRVANISKERLVKGWERKLTSIGRYYIDHIDDLEENEGIWNEREKYWDLDLPDIIKLLGQESWIGRPDILRLVPRYLYTQKNMFIPYGSEEVCLLFTNEDWITIIYFWVDEKSLIGKQYGQGRVAWEEAQSKA